MFTVYYVVPIDSYIRVCTYNIKILSELIFASLCEPLVKIIQNWIKLLCSAIQKNHDTVNMAYNEELITVKKPVELSVS